MVFMEVVWCLWRWCGVYGGGVVFMEVVWCLCKWCGDRFCCGWEIQMRAVGWKGLEYVC